MKSITAITIKTTAADTVLTDNVTLGDPDIQTTLAIMRAAYIAMAIAITKCLNADVRTTKTVNALNILLPLKQLIRVQISADIMTPPPKNAFIT